MAEFVSAETWKANFVELLRKHHLNKTDEELRQIADELWDWASEEGTKIHEMGHEERCCREHGTHSTPHKGCILR